MTLSHCWGGQDFLILTRSNYAQLRKRIPESRLTKTFTNTIDLTRRLGVRYLWIDSFCVIQGDLKDWEVEGPRMLDVYRGGVCNIAATGAANGNVGLFYERSKPVIDPPLLQATGAYNHRSISREAGIGVAITTHHTTSFVLADDSLWANGVSKSPLGIRSWCLQERVLVPRTIHFSNKQLFFEYQKGQCYLTFPDGIPQAIIPESEQKHLFSLNTTNTPASQLARQDWTLKLWKNFVATYSSYSLTRLDDKLVAITGLASYISQIAPGLRYHAGIWDYRAVSQLL
jgi:hypothetical protein